MSLSRRLSLVVIAGLLAGGCATSVSTDDGPDDSGLPTVDGGAHDGAHDSATHADSASGDTGTESDTGGGNDKDASEPGNDAGADEGALDATVPDATVPDANVPDTNVPDTSVPDTSIPDTSVPDTNVPDTSVPDTSIPDTSVPDTSIPDTSVPDTGVDAGTCHPPTTGFTPVYHAPRAQALACSTNQITNFYNDCLSPTGTSALCTTWRTTSSNATCNGCLTGASSPTGTTWGPLIQYPQYVVNDQGGCIALDQGASQSACAHDLEYQTECEHFACDTGCATSTDAEYQTCITAADNGLCASYGAAAQVDCTVKSVCFGGTDFATNFKQVATVFCQ